MDKNHTILLGKLIDNIFQIAESEDNFINEIVINNKSDNRIRTKSGIFQISALVSNVKLELGRQKHLKTERIFILLSKLNETKFIETITTFNSNASFQMALQFYRKLNNATDKESIKEDSLLIELIDNIDDVDSFETYINEH